MESFTADWPSERLGSERSCFAFLVNFLKIVSVLLRLRLSFLTSSLEDCDCECLHHHLISRNPVVRSRMLRIVWIF